MRRARAQHGGGRSRAAPRARSLQVPPAAAPQEAHCGPGPAGCALGSVLTLRPFFYGRGDRLRPVAPDRSPPGHRGPGWAATGTTPPLRLPAARGAQKPVQLSAAPPRPRLWERSAWQGVWPGRGTAIRRPDALGQSGAGGTWLLPPPPPPPSPPRLRSPRVQGCVSGGGCTALLARGLVLERASVPPQPPPSGHPWPPELRARSPELGKGHTPPRACQVAAHPWQGLPGIALATEASPGRPPGPCLARLPVPGGAAQAEGGREGQS